LGYPAALLVRRSTHGPPLWARARGHGGNRRHALGGTITNHLVNWLSPLKERVTIITGEKGAFVADTLSADLTFYANGQVQTTWDDIANFRGVSEGDVVRYAISKPEPLRVEHEQFRDAVLGKDADIVTMKQGLTTVRVAEACLESAQTSSTISLA
jgi:UDP-N-acetylglucosamine 3-dehydrogenase